MKSLNVGFMIVFLLAILMACSGCEEAATPCTQGVHAGRIEGWIYSGGMPINAVIAAIPIVNGVATNSVFQVEPHYSGSYSLDVPEGYYVVQLQVDGTNVAYDHPDTVFVDSPRSPVMVDFHFGGIVFELTMSPSLDGEWAVLVLHRREEIGDGPEVSYVSSGSEIIQNGHLNMYMGCVLPGEYQMEVVLGPRNYMCNYPYDGEHIWLPGTRDQNAASWYAMAADSLLYLDGEFAMEPARIEGHITGAWLDMGLESAPELSIVSPDSVSIMGRRRINDDGSFAVDLHLPGPVKLLVTHNGLGQWIGGPGFQEATIFTPLLGEIISGIDLVQCGITMSVDVPEDYLGTAYFHFYDASSFNYLGYAVKGGGGIDTMIGLTNLWPGDFLMQVTHRSWGYNGGSWRPQWFDRATEPEQAQLISIGSPGEILSLDLVLELGGEISGQIVQDADPRLSYYVIITSADDQEILWYEFAYHGYDSFSINALPDGEFKVGALLAGEGWNWPDPFPATTVWCPGTMDWNSAESLEILDASTLADVDIDVR